MDRRKGRNHLTGGLGFAEPCFPRDNIALKLLGKKLAVDIRLLKTNHDYNQALSKRHRDTLGEHIPAGSKVTVLGLAYKPLSYIIEESPGIRICQILGECGHRVVEHDPLAVPEAKAVLNQKV